MHILKTIPARRRARVAAPRIRRPSREDIRRVVIVKLAVRRRSHVKRRHGLAVGRRRSETSARDRRPRVRPIYIAHIPAFKRTRSGASAPDRTPRFSIRSRNSRSRSFLRRPRATHFRTAAIQIFISVAFSANRCIRAHARQKSNPHSTRKHISSPTLGASGRSAHSGEIRNFPTGTPLTEPASQTDNPPIPPTPPPSMQS